MYISSTPRFLKVYAATNLPIVQILLLLTRRAAATAAAACSIDSFAIPKSSVSLLIPDEFCEKYVRIYCRDPAKSAIVQKAFRAFVASFGSRLAPHIGFSLPSPTRFDALGRD